MDRSNSIRFSPDEVIRKLTALFGQRTEVVLAYLFGSYATGRMHKFSDVDVAVYVSELVKENEFQYTLDLIGPLHDVLRSDDVDLVVLNFAPPTLRHHIIRQGLLLKCTDEAFRRRYLIKTFKEYEDARHLLKIQHEYRDRHLASFGKS